MAEAAENRMKAQEGRGVKDPEALKQKIKRQEELERKQATMGGTDEGGLRVSRIFSSEERIFHIMSRIENPRCFEVSLDYYMLG